MQEIPDWLKPRQGRCRLMYIAHPRRLHDQGFSPLFCEVAKKAGYTAINTFSLDTGEALENGLVGRPTALELDMCLQRGCGVSGYFGLSEGTMGELDDRLKWDPDRRNFRVFPQHDPMWDRDYPRYQELFERLRGNNRLVAIVGPSGIKKTYWIDRLQNELGPAIQRVKNVTTRQPRDEQDSKRYYIVTKSQFEEGLKNSAFFDYDIHFNEYYGCSLDEIKSVLQSSHGIFALTPAGAQKLYECRFEINLEFVLLKPASEEVLKANLASDGIDDPARQKQYLERAKDFMLPSWIPHKTLELTGKKEDEDRVFKLFESLLK